MKTIHKFLLTCALAVTIIPVLTVACGVETECTVDEDCTAPDVCNEILGICESAGEGEGEGEEGEGEEGEGEGGPECDAQLEFDDAAGTGLDLDEGDITENVDAEPILDCADVNDGVLFDVTAVLTGDYDVPPADAEDGNDVEFAFAGGAPSSCSTFPSFANLVDFGDCTAPEECLVYCPICIVDDTSADDAAMQVIDEAGELSNAECLERT